MGVLPSCMCVYHLRAWYLQRSEEEIGPFGTGVTEGCKQPCDTRNQTRVLWERSQCPKFLSHLSSTSERICCETNGSVSTL